jgi:hypothetical protein
MQMRSEGTGMSEREIIKEMFRRYPVTDRERGCAAEKRKRDSLREMVRQRLNEQNRQTEVQPGGTANK